MNIANIQKMQMANFMLPGCPFIAVNPAVPGVRVPEHLRRDGLVMRIGMTPGVMGMPDLNIMEWGWRATIIVGEARHQVDVPWEAVDRMWLDGGPLVIWPTPAEAEKLEPLKSPTSVNQEKPGKPVLRLVKKEG